MVNIQRFSGAVASLLKPSRKGRIEPLGFPGITSDHLEKFNIIPHEKIQLSLKPSYVEKAAITSSLGLDQFWSSANFHCHLEALQSLVPNVNEKSAHPWIDAFFFRASAMVPPNEQMVLSLEQVIQQTMHPSSSTTPSGFIDYTAVIADKNHARFFFSDPSFTNLKTLMPSGFFVAEAKIDSVNLMEHLPQTVGEMFACAKKLKMNTLRGALTDGHSWIFVILVLNVDGNGAKYRRSDIMEFQSRIPFQIAKPWPDVLAGILFHWIKNSFADVGDDDWFEM